MKSILLALAMTFIVGCQSAKKISDTHDGTSPKLPETLEEATTSHYRTDANRARDMYRHPVETLTFFGIQPNMTVVEISPGAGWYMEILAPYLNQNGTYIAALPPSDTEYMGKLNEKVSAWLKSHSHLDQKVVRSTFGPPDQIDFAPEGTADMVLTFRNVHNWMSKGSAQAAFNGFFKALKPGGTLGVVEHRANARSKKDPLAKSGYVHESQILEFAKKAGFKLAAKSEINANRKDMANHPEGVWTLPPSLKLGEKDKEKYLAIGESDRMTIKFIKPAK